MVTLTWRWVTPTKAAASYPLKRSTTALSIKGGRQTKRPSWFCRRAGESDEVGAESVESDVVDANLCPGCGVNLSEAPNGCDREGHIASGIGALVGFEWWPIKVYRPCPTYEASGKTYVRKGQITNEILFKRKERTEL